MFVSLQEELAFFKTLFAIACIVALIGGTLFCLVLRRYALRTRKYERDGDDLLSALARAKADAPGCRHAPWNRGLAMAKPLDHDTLAVIEEYHHLFNNTGGNPPVELLEDLRDNERMVGTNIVR